MKRLASKIIPGLKRPDRQKAQAMVEFALILPFLLLLVFGIIELGRLLVIYSSVQTASREAARYASASGISGNGVEYYIDCQGIRDAAKRVGLLIGIQDADISISYDEGPGSPPTVISSTCPVATDAIDLGDRVVVAVSADFETIMPLVPVPSFTISADSVRTIVKNVSILGTPLPGFPTDTPTATNTSTATLTATSTETPTSTPTETEGPTPTATNTIPPTSTSTATSTATHTPIPTNTSTATPTYTPTINPCTIELGGYVRAGTKIVWTLTNTGTDTFTLQSISIPWTGSAIQSFQQVQWGAAILWTGSDFNEPTSIGPTPSFDYQWTPTAPDFTFQAGPATSKDMTLTWVQNIQKISGITIAIFINDRTGTDCSVSSSFD